MTASRPGDSFVSKQFTRDSSEQQVVPVYECEASMYERLQPRALTQLGWIRSLWLVCRQRRHERRSLPWQQMSMLLR